MLIIGLTGGIGSGKSTVAKYFKDLGIDIIDTDLIAREVLSVGTPAYQEIINHFGTDILNDNKDIDRPKLRDIIFHDFNERHWLEQLTHPLIREEVKRQITLVNSPYCIIVIPLLLETGEQSMTNHILVVDLPEIMQKERTKARDGITDELIEEIMHTQVTREIRRMKADDIIDNSGSKEDLHKQVLKLHQKYLALCE